MQASDTWPTWIYHTSRAGLCIIMSLISKRLAQRLGMKRKQLYTSISGIGRNPCKLSPRSTVDFKITSLKRGERRISVQAIVLSRVSSNLSLSLTPFNDKWKQLKGLELAHPDLEHLDESTHFQVRKSSDKLFFIASGLDVRDCLWQLKLILAGCSVACQH